MLGLPKSTEISVALPKTKLKAILKLNKADEKKLDAEVSRMALVNQITAPALNLTEGNNIKSFCVARVIVKNKNFDKASITKLFKIIPQQLILVLEYEGEYKAAVYYDKFISTDWFKEDEFKLTIKGLNLDTLWDNIVMQIGSITLEAGNVLSEQIAIDDNREKLHKEIEKLEKQARNEKQPKKKFELVSQIKVLKSQLENLK